MLGLFVSAAIRQDRKAILSGREGTVAAHDGGDRSQQEDADRLDGGSERTDWIMDD